MPGGFPSHTYNPRDDRKLEAQLSEVEDNLCKLVAVTGQTKSGKTVLARKVLPQVEAVWIDGGIPSDEEELWQLVVENLGLFQDVEEETFSSTVNRPCILTPSMCRWGSPGGDGRKPLLERSASPEGACERGIWFRFLRRQLSLPVSMMSQ